MIEAKAEETDNQSVSFLIQKASVNAWNDGVDFAKRACGWWSAKQNPQTAGLYAVRDDYGNFEIATWLCDSNGKNGEWTHELRDVDRDKIIAWMKIPDDPFIDDGIRQINV